MTCWCSTLIILYIDILSLGEPHLSIDIQFKQYPLVPYGAYVAFMLLTVTRPYNIRYSCYCGQYIRVQYAEYTGYHSLYQLCSGCSAWIKCSSTLIFVLFQNLINCIMLWGPVIETGCVPYYRRVLVQYIGINNYWSGSLVMTLE